MKIIEEYKFFSKSLLKEANDAARREKRNRYIKPSIINKLPLGFIYYIEKVIYHRQNELRLFVKMNKKKEIAQLDVSITRYNSLPKIRYYENGNFDLKFYDRPYPNGRKWQEKEIKIPLRKQNKFRKLVLTNYNNCCAFCEINDVSILRAAHILDVKDGGPDTLDNGIALCANHEIAFDIGKIIINPDFTVDYPNNIGVTVKKIKLPSMKENYPNTEFIKKKTQLINSINTI